MFSLQKKYIFFELINKFYYKKLTNFNLTLKLKLKLNESKFKLILINCLSLEFFCYNKHVYLKKFNNKLISYILVNFICSSTNKVLRLIVKLKLETLFFNKKLNYFLFGNQAVFYFKNFIQFSKLENLYMFFNTRITLVVVLFNQTFLKKCVFDYFIKKYFCKIVR